jgi:COP9 signalosome complex subunit 6
MKMLEFNENPFYLLLDPLTTADRKELPITLYETEVKVVNDEPTLRFTKVPYKIETGEAERIAVDHIARVGASGIGSQCTFSSN